MESTKFIFVITGYTGSGKTTLAQCLSEMLGRPMVEADHYHSEINKAKMSSGTALTDNDRWDWIITVREAAVEALRQDGRAIFLTFPCQGKKYRDVLRIAVLEDRDLKMTFLHLKVEQDVLVKRVMNRVGHFINKDMIRAQIETQGVPAPPSDEGDVTIIDGAQDAKALALDLVFRLEDLRDVVSGSKEDTLETEMATGGLVDNQVKASFRAFGFGKAKST